MRRCDRGSAPVEFVLVSALLTFLVLGVLQVGLAVHVRTLLVAAAQEGARYAAASGRTPADGAARAREVLAASLGAGVPAEVEAGVEEDGGTPVSVVTVRARLPLIGLLGPARGLVVRGHAFAEPR